MPWSNQNGGGGGPWGGGGNGGNDGGGPWGGGGPQKPGGGNGGGGSPPDLEDILRRGSDRLKNVIPGGPSNANNPLMWFIGAIGLILIWLYLSFYTVQPDELAVELRFGKPKTEFSEPGLNFHIWPVETFEKVRTVVNQQNIGSTSSGRSGSSGLMLSGDQNIVDVRFSVFWQVADPGKFLFNAINPEDVIRQVSESAMREIVGRRPAQDIFRDNREGIAIDVKDVVQNTLDQYAIGVNINSVNIEDAAPPAEVADAFDEVQRAEQDEDKFREQANQYSNQQLGQARGAAAQLTEEAAAYKNRIVQEATGEAQRFLSVLEEYKKAPDVTRKRLFFESIAPVLADSKKVIVEPGNGVVPYLPLPAVEDERKRQAAQGANSQ